MDSDDDYSSGGASSSTGSPALALSPNPEEENLAPDAGMKRTNGTVETTPVKNKDAVPFSSPLKSAKRRRLASPTASISFDGAHAAPPSAIGGGLMPSSSQVSGPTSSQTVRPKGKGKAKDAGRGGDWEEVLERLGSAGQSRHRSCVRQDCH